MPDREGAGQGHGGRVALLEHIGEELRLQGSLIRTGRLSDLVSSLERVGHVIAELEAIQVKGSGPAPAAAERERLKALAMNVLKLYMDNRAALERERARIAAGLEMRAVERKIARCYLGCGSPSPGSPPRAAGGSR